MRAVDRVKTGRALLAWLRVVAACLLVAGASVAQAVAVNATKDLTCAGNRFGSALNCTAGEFTVSPTFSASPGTPPFCMVGQDFNFVVDVDLSGSNADRQDIGFYVGQQGNDPGLTTAGNICSVAAFPTTPLPWKDNDSDTCGDYAANGSSTNRINEIKVVCTADAATSTLSIPYLLTYVQNNGGVCTGPSSSALVPGSTSKCNKGTATVSGVVSVMAGVWVDVTKATQPGGSTQDFTYTATGPAGTKVTALTGATLTSTGTSGGTYSPATIALATNSTTFTLKDGQTARVFMSGSTTARTLSIVESLASGWQSAAVSINCSAVTGSPTLSTDNATRTMTATLDTTNAAAACTITNLKLPTLQVTKVSTGDVGTWTFSGTNGWANENVTTVTSGVGVSSSRQVLAAVSTSTAVTESAVAGFRMTGGSCTGMGAGGTATVNTTTRTITLDAAATAAGSDISCTFNNIRTRTLTVTKSLSPVADGGKFVMNANGTTGVEAGNGATSSAAVDVGAAVTASEAAGTSTALANYTSTYSCNTSPVTSGNGTSVNFTMPNADVTCTITNTRKSATLVLQKTWSNAINGNTATVSTTGFTNNASSGASVSTGNNTTTGGSVTVYAGESGTIGESFSVGSAANYTASLACTGTSGLSGSTLTVAPADTAITCTLTNTRNSATLVLQKTWANGKTGDTATVTSSGFTNNASSGASVSSGNNTTAGTSVTVYAAESGTIGESFSVGSAANYTASLACTGTSGLSGTTLTVGGADTAIVCTETNTRKSGTLTLRKTWSNGIGGDTATVTSSGFANAASSGLSVSSGNNTTTGAPVTVYAAESGTIGESFSVGSAANYTASLACTGTSGLSGTTLTVDAADAAIVCTETNTRNAATLALRKTWANAINGDTATVTTTGFTNDASSGASVSTGNNSTTGGTVTVYAGETGAIGESFSVGSAANYTAGVSCAGTSGLSGSNLTVGGSDAAILCTLTNTRRSASLTLQKTWSNATVGDTATVASSGFINNASSGASVSTGNNTTSGASVTVYAAESGSIAESFSVGSAANYVAALACTGTSGLSGTTLTVAPADTVITCTYTNTKNQPVLTLTKLQSVISDPVNGAVHPKSIPGAVRSYTLRLTNAGPGVVDNDSVVIADALPSTVELYVQDLAGAGQGPVIFADGTPSSGLTWTFTSLADMTDSVDFSSDNGVTWAYVPVPDADGFDPAVTHIRLRPAGAMNAAGVGNPYADMTFRVRVK